MASLLPFLSSCGVIAVLAYGGCGRHAVAVEFYLVDGYHFAQAERDTIQSIADAAARDVRVVLPQVPRGVTLKVYSGADVIPETGEGMEVRMPAALVWTVDPKRPGGVTAIARSHLRATLFHHFHHLVRYHYVPLGPSLRDNVVSEGLATVFERDFGGGSPPWAHYPPDIEAWTADVLSQPDRVPLDKWLITHPDGRRWVGIRAGAYLVDRVVSTTTKTAATLVDMPTRDIIAAARPTR